MKNPFTSIREAWHAFHLKRLSKLLQKDFDQYCRDKLAELQNQKLPEPKWREVHFAVPQQRIEHAIKVLKPQAEWNGPIPLPDSETWTHYCQAMATQDIINILMGVKKEPQIP